MSDGLQTVGPMERLLFLKTVPVLEHVGPPELAVIAEHATERNVRGGTAIFRAGEPVEDVCVVVDGRVLVTGGEHPRGVVVGPEEQFGLLSFLARSERGLEAVAQSDTLVLSIEGDVFLDLFEEHFYVLNNVVRLLARDLITERRAIPDGEYLGGREDLMACPERPLGFVERVLIIRRGAAFQNSSLDGVSNLARQLEEVRVGAGEKLWSSGDRSGYTAVLVSGRVRCVQGGGKGTFFAGGGYPLGNVESLAGEPRWYDAIAETPVVALCGNTEMFLDVLEDDFQMALDFIRSFAVNLIRVRGEANAQRPVTVGA